MFAKGASPLHYLEFVPKTSVSAVGAAHDTVPRSLGLHRPHGSKNTSCGLHGGLHKHGSCVWPLWRLVCADASGPRSRWAGAVGGASTAECTNSGLGEEAMMWVSAGTMLCPGWGASPIGAWMPVMSDVPRSRRSFADRSVKLEGRRVPSSSSGMGAMQMS